MNFSNALNQARQGKLIARSGWNGKGMFVFVRPSDSLNKGVIESAKSIPYAAKQKLLEQEGETVHFTEYMCLKMASGVVANGWTPNQIDILSEDWEVIE